MTTRRSFLFGLLGGIGLAPSGIAIGATVPPGDDRPLAKETARALDEADVAFSQRPQVHYNRQRQHQPRQRHRRRRAPRRHR